MFDNKRDILLSDIKASAFCDGRAEWIQKLSFFKALSIC